MTKDEALRMAVEAINACREALEDQKPYTEEDLSLMAFNDAPTDWNDLNYRQCWLDGYVIGARAINSRGLND